MKDPAFLFYSSDFLSGVTDLTMEERGQYITLLCLQHQKGHLTDKTIRLTVGSVSVDVLSKFSKDQENCFFNKRLDEEIAKRLEFTESRRINGLKGGRPKALGLPLAKPNGLAKNNLADNENEDVNGIVIKGDIKEKFIIINSHYANSVKYRLHGIKSITEFLEMNNGIWPRTDFCDKFLREKHACEFKDYSHVINAYNQFVEKQFK